MLNRSLLPPASSFYRDNLQRFRSRGRKAIGLCPFHEDHKPSLSIDLDRGLFHCFVCGAGGDIIKFVQLRDGLTFMQACKELGAWQESDSKPTKRVSRLRCNHRRRHLTLAWTEDGVNYAAVCVDEPKDFLDLLRRIRAEAGDRLTELHRGDAERFPDETEACWSVLADASQLIWQEVGRE